MKNETLQMENGKRSGSDTLELHIKEKASKALELRSLVPSG